MNTGWLHRSACFYTSTKEADREVVRLWQDGFCRGSSVFQHCLWYLKYQPGCISNRVYGSRHAIIEQGRGVFDNQKPSACSFSCPQQWYVSFGNPVSSRAFSLRYSGATHSTSSFSLKHECYILTHKPSLTVEIKKSCIWFFSNTG